MKKVNRLRFTFFLFLKEFLCNIRHFRPHEKAHADAHAFGQRDLAPQGVGIIKEDELCHSVLLPGEIPGTQPVTIVDAAALLPLPQLLPLMVINFVGAFIAAFQGMGSIFLLTFGGPGDATNVLSLVIWKEAYNNLRFSTATTMAWFLGTALIAFTYLQIRFLRRVEFRQAAAN